MPDRPFSVFGPSAAAKIAKLAHDSKNSLTSLLGKPPAPPVPPKSSGDDQGATGTQDDGPAEKPKQAKKRWTCEEANTEALKIAKADPEFVASPNAREWTKAIGCSIGLIPKLPLWIQTMAEIGKGKDKSPASKAKTLTPAVEEIETPNPTRRAKEDATELDRLIDEQTKDAKSDRCAKKL